MTIILQSSRPARPAFGACIRALPASRFQAHREGQSMSNTDIIRDFFAAWEAQDVEKIMGGFAPDARWLNVGLPEAVGLDAIRKSVEPFVKSAQSVEFVVHHIAE